MDIDRLLKRQVGKYLRDDLIETPEIEAFLKKVRSSYWTLYQDKLLSDHAFNVVEKEYLAVIKEQQQQNDLMRESVQKIIDVASKLRGGEFEQSEEPDLTAVIEYLEEQTEKTKQLEADILKARDDARQASRAKSDFLSVMSHEIRTPLNVINGISHILMDDEHLPHQTESITMLSTAATNLRGLIDDVLDFNKIEEGKVILTSEPFNIRHFLNDVKGTAKYFALEKGNSVKLLVDEEIPENVMGDRNRLGQVLNNLVSNAVKFTDKGLIRIEAELDSLKSDNCTISFTVSDTGIGIDKDKQEDIFERFVQIDAGRNRISSGSGLGLTITKRLLELMGSEITLKSEKGKGTTFSFPVTFKRAEESEEQRGQVTERNSLKGVQVLLVEDVEFNIIVAKTLLEKKDAIVTIARNGVEAIELCKSNDFDVILMDLRMPLMDGYEATERIREINKTVPILALTASVSSQVQKKVTNLMTGFIGKPFQPEELYAQIIKYLPGSRL